jgi:hypothetical protein
MHYFRDISNQRFGRLLVLERVGKKWGSVTWRCRCDCGNELITTSSNLTKGRTKSCGCLQREWASSGKIKREHGLSESAEYRIWCHIKCRCYNANSEDFKWYGGRGIKMCDEWLHDFMAFYNHIGPRPNKNLSIDRINNDGNYEPGNVRWATSMEQAHNKNRGSHD